MEDVVDDHVFRPTDEASIALLRGLRTNTIADHNSFIHHADVCSAAPEELVAGLQPVPGTDEAEDGYHSVWYFYCPKRYKNTRGKLGGHRQRAVGPEDRRTCWHSETGKTKPVHGVPGATFCNLSFVRKDVQVSSGHVEKVRLGWCMTEFDDAQGGGGDHVLCKVHRASSSLAKKRSKSSASSACKSKRKAAGDDHPEAPPSKLIHHNDEQVHVQQDAAAFSNDNPVPYYDYELHQNVDPVMVMIGGEHEDHGVQQPRVEPEHGQLIHDEQMQVQAQQNPTAFFSNAYPTMPCYVHGHGGTQGMDPVTVVSGSEEEDHDVQQPRVEPEHAQLIHEEQEHNPAAFFTNAYPMMPCFVHGHGVDPETMFGGEEEEYGVQQQPCVESEAEDGGEFNIEDLIKMEEFNFEVFLQEMFQTEREQGLQQPIADPEQGREFVVPAVLSANLV